MLCARPQTVSHEAFAFCLTHQRKTEFRRLSETLRSHLTSSQKYSHQSHSINLNDPDTLQRHLDTRFQQLNTAVDLELWQEAFRTAEDIHGLVGMSKRAPKASMMASFYEKMVKVFGVGQNYLFHAAAYGKLYSLHAARAAVSGDKAEDAELEKLSSLVLLSALAVPIGSGLLGEGGKRREAGEEGEAKGKLGRLAALLGLAAAPTRAGLITDAVRPLAPPSQTTVLNSSMTAQSPRPQARQPRAPRPLHDPRGRLPPSLDHVQDRAHPRRPR